MVIAGQVLLQILGRVVPSAVRYPGPWVPTATEDTGVYLSAAAQLPQIEPNLWTKALYIWLIRLDHALGLGGWGLLAMQSLLLVAAGLALLRYVGSRWGRRAGLISVAVLVLNPNVTQWTKTIFTEAVFMPLMVLLVLLLATSLERPQLHLPALVVAGLSLAVRPNGFGALLGAVTVVALNLRRWRFLSLAAGAVLLAAAAVLSPAFQTPGGDENTLAARTYEGLVIWVSPDFVRTEMPPAADVTDLSNSAVIRYAVEHPLAVASLGARRIFWEIVQVRPHYPAAANILVTVQMMAFFGLAIVGLLRSRGHPITRSIVGVSLGLFLVIAATWAIAEGRFGWAVFATWSPWVGIGADDMLRRARRGTSDLSNLT
jgi:4-amino-4-deoxy-L-arabinose transferase-like glycosyltransferase